MVYSSSLDCVRRGRIDDVGVVNVVLGEEGVSDAGNITINRRPLAVAQLHVGRRIADAVRHEQPAEEAGDGDRVHDVETRCVGEILLSIAHTRAGVV